MIGVITPDGTAVAFPTAAAKTALSNGRTVATAGVEVYTDGAGLRTRTPDGSDLASHQAFWFAWSLFHPDSILWGAILNRCHPWVDTRPPYPRSGDPVTASRAT